MQGKKFKLKIKRILDIVLSLMASVLLLVPFIFISTLIMTYSRGYVFFKQKRSGKGGKPFYLYKFRTMKDLSDEKGNLLPDEKRLTRIGNFLRKLSLDEIPELWNVLKGDMSIVGPRPLLAKYLKRYTPDQARRLEVKPGITGWAQVNGRNAITWKDKFKFDVWYVDNWTLWLDFKIILLSIIKVIKGEGIRQPGQATMEEFKGDQ